MLYADDVLHTAGGALQTFDPTTAEPIGAPRTIPGGVLTGTRLMSAGPYLQVVGAGWVLDIDELGDIPPVTGYTGETVAFAGGLSPDGRVAAFAANDGLTFWARDGVGLFVDAVVPAGTSPTRFNSISTDGRTVVQGGNVRDDISASVWSLATGDPTLETRIAPGRGVRQFDNDIVTFGPGDDSIDFEYWNAETASFEPLIAAEFETSGAIVPAFTPDRKQFLHPWVLGEGILDVHDVQSGRLLHRLTDVGDVAPPDINYSTAPTFSTDGERLVYTTESSYVAVYDTATWNLLELLEPATGFSHIAFTPDGNSAVTPRPADSNCVMRTTCGRCWSARCPTWMNRVSAACSRSPPMVGTSRPAV